jgi:hypothetical protein
VFIYIKHRQIPAAKVTGPASNKYNICIINKTVFVRAGAKSENGRPRDKTAWTGFCTFYCFWLLNFWTPAKKSLECAHGICGKSVLYNSDLDLYNSYIDFALYNYRNNSLLMIN